ncbi:endonuclease/exonuclease/phosphatase family protein [Pseudoxanthomonas sp.]|uniref:endonuclease/exonuclease/phosphatase family protein n=1 Tax=Pseudoxanthomonas sp. TaxID=1871049 RepID=UPI0025DFC4D8|nr:endonuclease/exonuclease/phosphatase family protein [Pseudoxanthomonas sp.]
MARWTPAVLAVVVFAAGVLAACQRPRELPTQSHVDVVTLNLWHDKQDWPHRQDMIVAELATLAPDIIVLQEVLQDAALPNQAQTLAARLGYRYRFFSADAAGQARRYGNAILVKGAIEQSREVKLSPLDDYRTAGWVRTRVGGRPLNVYVTHLHHTPTGGAIRADQIGGVLALIGETSGDAPSIIGGDFNTRADASELAPLRTRFFDAYSDAHAGVDTNDPMHTTLNPHLGHAPIRIDHVFAQRDAFRVVDADIILDRPDATGAWPSDHYGVRVRLARSPD